MVSIDNLKQWYSLWSHFWAEEALYEAGYGCTLLANQLDAVEERRAPAMEEQGWL